MLVVHMYLYQPFYYISNHLNGSQKLSLLDCICVKEELFRGRSYRDERVDEIDSVL
jgi:hypothetical protein